MCGRILEDRRRAESVKREGEPEECGREKKVRIRWIAEERRAAWKHKAVVLKRFWSHNQEKKSESTKEWAFKRKLHGSVCVCVAKKKKQKKRMEKANFVCV